MAESFADEVQQVADQDRWLSIGQKLHKETVHWQNVIADAKRELAIIKIKEHYVQLMRCPSKQQVAVLDVDIFPDVVDRAREVGIRIITVAGGMIYICRTFSPVEEEAKK
jgi:hypothetical protein